MNIAVMRSSGIFTQKNCTLRTWSVLFLDDLVFIIHQIIRAIPKGVCQKFFHLILVQIDIAEISIVFRVVNIICARIAGCLSFHKSYSVLSILYCHWARSAPKPLNVLFKSFRTLCSKAAEYFTAKLPNTPLQSRRMFCCKTSEHSVPKPSITSLQSRRKRIESIIHTSFRSSSAT